MMAGGHTVAVPGPVCPADTSLSTGWEKLPAPAGGPGRPDLFDDPSYVNVQNLDKARQASSTGLPGTTNGSTQRDLFDMSEWAGLWGHRESQPCWRH